MEKAALLLDLDDTLVPSERIYKKVLKDLNFGVEAYQSARTTVKGRFPSRHVSARNRLLYFKNHHETQSRYSPAKTLEMMACYEELIEREFKEAWLGLGRNSLFDRLEKRFAMAIVTNENARTQLLKLRAIDPEARFFKTVVISEEFGVEKPDKVLFSEALKRLGAKPTDAIFIGDSIENDILPAKELGMRAIRTTEFVEGGTPLSGIEVIGKLDDLKELL